tara:strand:- start:8786 stop:10360 length:1575 start_codon:yes stop_codon:yes gene_type:complete
MGNTKPIIDVDAMYRAGYASGKKPSDKQHRVDLINQLVSFAGQHAISYFAAGYKNLSKLRDKSNGVTSGMDLAIKKVGPQLSPEVNSALGVFKKEYDKGARMFSLGVGKKKRKGQEMMNLAMAKMNQLNSDLIVLQQARKKTQTQSLMMNGEEGDAETRRISPGAKPKEFYNTTLLGNGDMLNHLTVDGETGRLMFVSEEEIQAPMGPMQKGETLDLDKDGIPTGVDAPEYETKYTYFGDLKFAQDENPELEIFFRKQLDNATGNASKSNFVWDDDLEQKELFGYVNGLAESKFRSFFFGGMSYDYSNNKMDESAPAYQMIQTQFATEGKYNPNTGEYAPGYQPGGDMWEGQLEMLKEENMGKGSMYRRKTAEMLYGLEKQKYDEHVAVRMQRQQEKENQTRRTDRSKPASIIVDGQYRDRNDAVLMAEDMLKKDSVTFGRDERGNGVRFVNLNNGYHRVERLLDDGSYAELYTISTNEALQKRGFGVLGFNVETPKSSSEADLSFLDFDPNKEQRTEFVTPNK